MDPDIVRMAMYRDKVLGGIAEEESGKVSERRGFQWSIISTDGFWGRENISVRGSTRNRFARRSTFAPCSL